MKWTEYDITKRIRKTLDTYAGMDTTCSHIRQLRFNDVKCYARDLLERGYSTQEVHYYVNQITKDYGFGMSQKVVHQISDEIITSKYIDTGSGKL